MPHLNELHIILNKTFHWNKARMDCFVMMIISLFFKQSSNLVKLSTMFMNDSKSSSSYRRIQRFLKEHIIDFNVVASFIYHLFELDKIYLTLDRTNWKYGKKNINILMLGIVHKGTAIPLMWSLLDKKGISKTSERIDIIQGFISLFGKDKIHCLLGDREFVGCEWFQWLNNNHIDFCIRVKKNSLVPTTKGNKVQIHTFFRDLKDGESVHHPRRMRIDGVLCSVSVSKMNDKLLIVATNNRQYQSIDTYKKRWEIETLFSCMKTKGFNLEDTSYA